MRYLFLITIFVPFFSYAVETIDCNFYKFHQAHLESPELTGFVVIDQRLVIDISKTSGKTFNIGSKKRAANSINWILLESPGFETYSTTYAGDFGELLTFDHKLGKKDGWYNATLVSSSITTTHTRIGKCVIR